MQTRYKYFFENGYFMRNNDIEKGIQLPEMHKKEEII